MADSASTVIDLNLIKPAESVEARKERLKKALQGRLEEFVRQFLPAATIQGNHARIGSVSGEKGQSCSINLETGQFIDFADNRYKGDAFTLVQELGGYPDFKHTLDEVEKWLGPGLEPAALQVRREESLKSAQADEQLPKPDLLNKAIYQYHDADGNHVANVAREDYTDGSKRFYQQSIGDDGTWQWKAPRKCHVYRLPDVKYQQSVVFVEGEKAADHLWNMNVPATTLMGGANTNLDKHDLKPLAGKNIILWPDNDDPGRDLMNKLKVRLTALGCLISEVKIPEYMPDKGDAADITEERIKEVLESAAGERREPKFHSEIASETDYRYESEIIKGIMPRVGVSHLYGESGAGKSFIALDWAQRICRGVNILDHKVKQADVIYCAFESYVETKKRLKALRIDQGINLDNLRIMECPVSLLDDQHMKDFEWDIEFYCKQAEEQGRRIGLVIIDTLTNAMAGGDANSGEVSSKIMLALQAMAARLQISIMSVAHTGKDKSRGISGSQNLKNTADTTISVSKEESDGVIVRTVYVDKVKSGEGNFTAGQYELNRVEVDQDEDGDPVTSAVVRYLSQDDLDMRKALIASSIELTPKQRQLCRFMREKDEAFTTKELAKRLDQHRSKLSSELNELVNKGAVLKETNGRSVWYRVNPNLELSRSVPDPSPIRPQN